VTIQRLWRLTDSGDTTPYPAECDLGHEWSGAECAQHYRRRELSETAGREKWRAARAAPNPTFAVGELALCTRTFSVVRSAWDARKN